MRGSTFAPRRRAPRRLKLGNGNLGIDGTMTKYVRLGRRLSRPLDAARGACPAPDAPAVQRALDRVTAAMSGSGIVAARIGPTGTQLFLSGVSGNARPLDAHTLFEIGSVTKTFTANVLAQMAMDGEVRLDDPVAKYLAGGGSCPVAGRQANHALIACDATFGPAANADELGAERPGRSVSRLHASRPLSRSSTATSYARSRRAIRVF